MDYLMNLDPEDWTEREPYEEMVILQGGPVLAHAQQNARELEKHFEMGLTMEQREWFHTASDAMVDATSLREIVATRIALTHGVGIGAALARHGDADGNAPEVAGLAAHLITALLASGLAPETALEVGETVLEALRLANLALGQIASEKEEGPVV